TPVEHTDQRPRALVRRPTPRTGGRSQTPASTWASSPALSARLEQHHAGRHRDVEALDVSLQGDRHDDVAGFTKEPPQSGALGAEDDGTRLRPIHALVRLGRVPGQANRPDAKFLE